jgi:ferrochelatase
MRETVGVLLMAYGGPDSLEDVEPYLLDIRGGRPTSPQLIEEVRERYQLIGGRSPLLDLTRQQATALEQALNINGSHFRTYVGMRHWRPYIRETMAQIARDGIRRLIAIPMAPHYSRMSVGAYIRKAEEARAELGVPLEVRYVESWNDEPLYLRALAEKVREALLRFPAEVRVQVPIIFTAHSLPQRILAEGDPYPQELMETVEGVVRQLGPVNWRFAYQSAGASHEPWLGPDAGAVLNELAAKGHCHMLIAPIGFVCDHVEILYDVDIVYRRQAEGLGMQLERTESLNASPLLIEALAGLVARHGFPLTGRLRQ